MSYLILILTAIFTVYLLSAMTVMKRVLAWKYKALIYGALTFFLLISVFLTFSHYDRYWKEESHEAREPFSGRLKE